MTRSALELDLAACHSCHKVSDIKNHECPRCGAHLHARKPASVVRATMFSPRQVRHYLAVASELGSAP